MSFDFNYRVEVNSVAAGNSPSLKYSAHVASVSLVEHRHDLERGGNCFSGVSVENSHFYPQNRAGILEWIYPRSALCAVLGDCTYRLTLAPVNSVQPAAALFSPFVIGFAEPYLRKKIEALDPVKRLRTISLSGDYVLEAFVVFTCLQQQGLCVMVYPGSFSTLPEIAQGLHPQAPDEPKALTLVSLCLKGR